MADYPHIDALEAYAAILVAERRDLIETEVANRKDGGRAFGVPAKLVEIQTAIDALDRAIEHERRFSSREAAEARPASEEPNGGDLYQPLKPISGTEWARL